MTKELTDLKWDTIQRMEEIERCLFWQGSLGRTELALRLRMSNPQTTAILKQYQEFNPGKIGLNNSSKRYEVDDAIQNLFYTPSLTDLESHTDTFEINSYSMTSPSRRTPMAVVRDIARTIYQNQSIEIFYHSHKEPNGKRRRITPHTFVTTTQRTHVRAWCHESQGFRDFIIGRISETGLPGEPGKTILSDEAWHTLLILKLKANPKLDSAQKKLIEMDFEMQSGLREVKVKQALLWYYFELYNLWPEHQFEDPKHQPVILGDVEVMKFLTLNSTNNCKTL
ncbi:MAG: WYL domain-containing protein [Methyloprofundus sp.]|nr:WYL domain-containing protein [Methyloprofundus sp.]